MKRFFTPLLLGLLLISPLYLSAQKRERIINLQNIDKRKLHFGYYLGLNKKGFKIRYNNSNHIINSLGENDYITVDEAIGFNIGLIVDYRLHENINVRFEPGLSSNTKKLTYNSLAPLTAGFTREISGTYLRLPFLLKLSTNRLDNMRPYIIGGVSYDYNFSSNENNVDDNQSGQQFRMKTNNFMYEVGLGVDLYLPYFKFSPSIRGVFALSNELVKDNFAGSLYTDPIDFFGTRGVFLVLTFENSKLF